MWDGSAVWKQAPLLVPTSRPGAAFFLVFEIDEDGGASCLWIYDPASWSLVCRFRLELPETWDLARTNYTTQMRYVSAIASNTGSLPPGVAYENCGWHAVSVYGWWDVPGRGEPVRDWRLLDMNDTYVAGKYPDDESVVAVSAEEPYYDVHVSIQSG